MSQDYSTEGAIANVQAELAKAAESDRWMVCVWRMEADVVHLYRHTHNFPFSHVTVANGLFQRQIESIKSEENTGQELPDLPKPPKPIIFAPENDNGQDARKKEEP